MSDLSKFKVQIDKIKVYRENWCDVSSLGVKLIFFPKISYLVDGKVEILEWTFLTIMFSVCGMILVNDGVILWKIYDNDKLFRNILWSLS